PGAFSVPPEAPCCALEAPTGAQGSDGTFLGHPRRGAGGGTRVPNRGHYGETAHSGPTRRSRPAPIITYPGSSHQPLGAPAVEATAPVSVEQGAEQPTGRPGGFWPPCVAWLLV